MDMQRIPPTTEPLSRNFADETIFSITADERHRQRRNNRRCERTPAR